MNDILLSIIIPTKDRNEVLFPMVISMINHLSDTSIEFVIQDNSSNNKQISEFINNLKDSRIKYFHKDLELTMSENFGFGISNALGKYILIIGDDDFVNPYIMNIIRTVDTKDINALIYPRGNYYWSDVVFKIESEFFEPESMQLIKEVDLNFEIKSSKIELDYLLSAGGIYLFNLPALYHGVVKKSLVDEIFKKHGSYALGPSPDMSLATALAIELESYYFVNFPVTIAGASNNSAAGMGRKGTHNTSLEQTPKWVGENLAKEWNPLLPMVWNGFTIYAQSIYQVLKAYKVDKEIDCKKQYNKILKDNINDLSYLQDLENFKNFGYIERNLMILKNRLYDYAKSILSILPNWIFSIIINNHPSFKKMKHVKNIKSIDEAMNWLKLEYKNLF